MSDPHAAKEGDKKDGKIFHNGHWIPDPHAHGHKDPEHKHAEKEHH